MGKALLRKNASQRKLIFSRWEKSNWIVELESAEVRSAIAEENARLAYHLEKTLEVEKLKENSDIRVTLEEANDENSTLHSELSSEKAKNEDLQHRLDAETGTRSPLQPLNSVVVGSRKCKLWDECSHRHKKRKIQELKEVVDLEDDQFEVTAIHVRNKDSGNSDVIPAQAGVQVAAEVQPRSDDQVKKVLLVKDRFEISEAYHELSMLDENLPQSCKINKETKQINDQWEISPIPGDCSGAEQSLKQRLSERIRNLICIDKNSPIKQSHKVRVKLTGDGTYIGSRQNIVTFGFTLLDEGASA